GCGRSPPATLPRTLPARRTVPAVSMGGRVVLKAPRILPRETGSVVDSSAPPSHSEPLASLVCLIVVLLWLGIRSQSVVFGEGGRGCPRGSESGKPTPTRPSWRASPTC